MLIFDIETGPLSDEQLQRFAAKFDPPPHPGEFDESSVKYGNTKDPAKRAEKLEQCSAEHAAAITNHAATVEAARATHWANVVEKAALSPVTGQVLAIGCHSITKKSTSIIEGDETDILSAWWSTYDKMRKSNRHMVGHNIYGFDLPFLVRRSMILRVDVPSSVYTIQGRYVNWDKLFIDTRLHWLLGQTWGDCESSLDLVARALDCGEKPEDVGGGDFARLYRGSPEDRAKAVAYLVNDLSMTAKVAERLGLAV